MHAHIAADAFEQHRPRLQALAYRMLGTRADAEDVVQDVWLKWAQADTATIRTPEAWLVTVATRLAIDRLRALQQERAAYTGWWLPEPVVEPWTPDTPESRLARHHEVSLALLWMLERLSPDERAAYLMREVFEHDYADVARILGKREAACRQLVSRAGTKLRDAPTTRAVGTSDVTPERHRQLLERFMTAAQHGHLAAMQALLAPDATAIGDGGGKVPSILKRLEGASRIAFLYYAVHRRHGPSVRYQLGWVNGRPGIIRHVDGRLESVQHIDVSADGRIQAIYSVRNPDKLTRVPALLHASPPLVTTGAGQPSW